MPNISVIICAHNPRPEYLAQTLDSLRRQGLPKDEWEFLLVDNASEQPLVDKWDLSWHPLARHVREDTLGLTPARLRGIHESTGGVLVFVDDDNILDSDYLQQAWEIAKAWPMLGVWGGRNEGRFEVTPPEWTKRHWGMLAIQDFKGNRWSNAYHHGEAHPCGAGMVARRDVVTVYAQKAKTDPSRVGLGRKGGALTSGEDTDIAMMAIDLGMGTGVFEALHLIHLIPKGRLEEPYLVRLAESIAYSGTVLHSLRGHLRPRPPFAKRAYDLMRLLFMDARSRRFELARRRGVKVALKTLGPAGKGQHSA
jgi:glycosyltransferase involved in cell wall biosynthesis